MKRLFTLAVLISLSLNLAAQGSLIAPEDKNLNWKGKLKKAESLLESGSFYSAIDYYLAVIDESPGHADATFGAGMAYYAARDYENAKGYFKKAYEADNKQYIMAQYYWGLMLKMTGEYQPAFDELKKFYRAYRGSDRNMKRIAKEEYEGCTLAMDLLNKVDERVTITHGGMGVNAAYTELSPKYFHDNENMLIYGSLRVEGDSIIKLSKGNNKMPRARIFTSKWNGEQWSSGTEFADLNDKKFHTGNASFSEDGKTVYYSRCTDDKGADVKCDIYYSELKGGGSWSDPKPFEFNDKKANDTHPTMARIRKKDALIWASDRERSVGGLDLWYSTFDRGRWQTPRNLGRKINTFGDEMTPWFDFDEDVLYFSSNGLENVGGLDIFKSKVSGTRWAKAINMGFPVNSSVDDMYYTHSANNKKGFFVSNRVGSIALKSPTCCDDIWAFEIIIPPVFTIMGNVYIEGDETKTPVADANVDLFYMQADTILDLRVSSPDTMFGFFRGTEYENYRLIATKQGFTRGTGTTSTVGLGPEDDTVYVDLYLRNLDTGIIVLRNLYFDLDKDFIRDDAIPSLDTVYQILIANPNIQIELASHTDSRNTHAYNEDLSQRRANSSKAWLVEKGIDSERIVAVGYGETKLLNECADGVRCTNLQHQINRRTEFRVIGEIPGTIVRYDKREVENAIENAAGGTGAINQTPWNFEEEPEEEEEGG